MVCLAGSEKELYLAAMSRMTWCISLASSAVPSWRLCKYSESLSSVWPPCG